MKTTHQRVYDFECDVCECHKTKQRKEECEISRSAKVTKRRRRIARTARRRLDLPPEPQAVGHVVGHQVLQEVTEGSETSLFEGGRVSEDEEEERRRGEERCQLCNFATEVEGGLLEHLMSYHVADCLGFRWQFKTMMTCRERTWGAPTEAMKLRLSIHVVDEIVP